MSWIRSIFYSVRRFRRRLFSRDNIIICLVTLVLLIPVNFAMIYFSPSFVSLFSTSSLFQPGISRCYRTFANYDSTRNDLPHEVIHGDSNAEGKGDEFRSGDLDYGLVNKLESVIPRRFIIFARGGYGTKMSFIEDSRCPELLNRYTNFMYDRSRVSHVTFVFYEGNDLANNIEQRDRSSMSDNYRYKKKFMFSSFRILTRGLNSNFIRYIFNPIKDYIKYGGPKPVAKRRSYLDRLSVDRDYLHASDLQNHNKDLSASDLELSLSIFQDSLSGLSSVYSGSVLQFLYIPSVATSYEYEGNLLDTGVIPVSDLPDLRRRQADYIARNDEIRLRILSIARSLGWQTCDSTASFRQATRNGLSHHGPVDWAHPNKLGFKLLLSEYLSCFGTD